MATERAQVMNVFVEERVLIETILLDADWRDAEDETLGNIDTVGTERVCAGRLLLSLLPGEGLSRKHRGWHDQPQPRAASRRFPWHPRWLEHGGHLQLTCF